MKIFLSWSGPRSRAVAEALNDWLRRIIQAVKPFYSPEIEKGAKWSSEIDDALEGTSFGIVCLTPDNLSSPWIHFEAGALSKAKDAKIWTFLHGLVPVDVPPPLGKFQHTVAEREDTLLLVKTINRRLGEVGGESLSERMLEENFETFWPQLEQKLVVAEKLAAPQEKSKTQVERPRDERAILNEILESVRNQERRLSSVETSLTLRPDQVSNLEPVLSADQGINDILIGTFRDFEIDLKEFTLRFQKELDEMGTSKNRIEVKFDRQGIRVRLRNSIPSGLVQLVMEEVANSFGVNVVSWTFANPRAACFLALPSAEETLASQD